MKTIIVYIVSMISWGTCLAQENGHTYPITDSVYPQLYIQKPQPRIKGQVLNASASDLENITVKYTLVNVGNPFQSSYELRLKKDGTFDISLPEKLPNRQVWFSLGDYLYTSLYSDEDLELTLDLAQLKQQKVYLIGPGILFGGKDGDKNRIMNEYIVFHKKYNADFSEQIEALNIHSDNYMLQLDSLHAVKQSLDQNFYQKFGETHRKLIEGETQAGYFAKKLAYLRQKKLTVASISEILTPVYAISNDSHEYFQFLNYYMRSVGFKSTNQKFSYEALARYYDKELPPEYADIAKLQFENRDIKQQWELYNQIKSTLHFDWSRDYIDVQLSTLSKKIAHIDSIGKASTMVGSRPSVLGNLILKTESGSALYLDKHSTGEALLKNIKAAFVDKLVVIDLWATWCIPCIQAMPHGKKLQEKISEAKLPIEFVYLCTSSGSDEQKWKNKVLELDQPGTHIFVNSKVISEVMNLFNKSGFPSYILLKPDGNYDSEAIQSIQQLDIETLQAKF